ncbi:hypothetical protein [Brachybacterium tyrofermentans]|uniref:hypothetical protein n=1 Tax=Brachybacterium tyrofermentans TaxID=47848 RepID=UPI001D030967|nr:hypothetical protein [Brachybacterium tyrofermentans]
MKTAKGAGTWFESLVAAYLAEQLEDDRIERRSKNGAKDRGDIAAVKHLGQRLVIECKEYGGQFKVGPWLAEAEVERGNDDAGVGLVVAKRRATRDPGEQVVMMTLADLASLITGERPA